MAPGKDDFEDAFGPFAHIDRMFIDIIGGLSGFGTTESSFPSPSDHQFGASEGSLRDQILLVGASAFSPFFPSYSFLCSFLFSQVLSKPDSTFPQASRPHCCSVPRSMSLESSRGTIWRRSPFTSSDWITGIAGRQTSSRHSQVSAHPPSLGPSTPTPSSDPPHL